MRKGDWKRIIYVYGFPKSDTYLELGTDAIEDIIMETRQEKEIYVLGLWECFGEKSICGVYTNKIKLIEGYQRIVDGNVRCRPFSDSPRKPFIYRFHANEFMGELPEWNDGKLWMDEAKFEISIREVQEKVEIYNDGCLQVFCNFNFEGSPQMQVKYIGGTEEDITCAELFLDTDTIEGEFSDDFVRYVLGTLKAWYNDNKEILKRIWTTKRYIPIPDWDY